MSNAVTTHTTHDPEPITFDQYAAIMATRPSVKSYSASEWAQMGAQHKALLALTYRRELAAL